MWGSARAGVIVVAAALGTAAIGAIASGCEASLGGRADGGRRTDAGDRDAAESLDAADALDAAPATDAASSVDAPVGVDAPVAIDSSVDGGLECRPEPRDCSPSSVTMEDFCVDGTSCYLAEVQGSVRDVIAAHPEWFDSSGSCDVVLDVESYMDAVVAGLVARGLCAIRDPNAPGEEVTVKYTNVFTESFDILASTGCARYGAAIYTSTCFPAWW